MLYACWYKCCISVGTNVVQVLVQVLYTCWYKCCTRVGTSVVSGKYVLICTTLFQFGCDQPLMWLQSVQWLRHKTSSGWPFPLWSDPTTTLRWTVNCRVRMSLNSCVQWDIWMMTSFNSQVPECFDASYFFFCEESLVCDTNLHNKDCSEMHSGSCSQMTSSCKCPITRQCTNVSTFDFKRIRDCLHEPIQKSVLRG